MSSNEEPRGFQGKGGIPGDHKCKVPMCQVPPKGWWCSRAPDHEGPCAARPKWWNRHAGARIYRSAQKFGFYVPRRWWQW